MLLNIDVLEPGGRGMALEWTEAVDWKRYICRYSDCVCTEHTNQPDQRVRVLLNFDESQFYFIICGTQCSGHALTFLLIYWSLYRSTY